MTTADLIAILRAHPDLARLAVEEAKIAGPRQGPPYNSRRRTLNGAWVGSVCQEAGRGYPFADLDSANPEQVRADRGETLTDFAVRIDDRLRALGWVLL